MVKDSLAIAGNTGDGVQSLGQEDPLKEEMATYSSILSWEIPLTEELGGLQSKGSKDLDVTERIHMHTIFNSC